MPTARYDTTNPTHDVTFFDKQKGKWGFLWDDGAASMIEQSQTPSTVLNRSGAEKWGDYDPSLAHLEQRTFLGGRGGKYFSEDNTRFFDSHMAFNLVHDRLVAMPQWKMADGITTDYGTLPGDVRWEKLIGSQSYIAKYFLNTASLAADNVGVWLRRVGNPGKIYCEIWTDAGPGDNPVEVVTDASDSYDPSDDNEESFFYNFDLSAAANLSASTIYWVVLRNDDNKNAQDDKNNCWEIACDGSDGNVCDISSNGGSWSNETSFGPYFRVSEAFTDRKFKFFELHGATMAVDILASGGNSTMYLNGEIGVATGATATTLTDTNEGEDGSWSTDQWAGWRIKIVAGDARGQHALISSNTDAGVITVDGFDVTPSVGDVYVIYGGDAWQSFAAGTTGLGTVLDVTVTRNIAYFAQGDSDNIRRIMYTSATHGFSYADDGTTKAGYLVATQNGTAEAQVWRANAKYGRNISVSDDKAWGTDLVFGTNVKVGQGRGVVNNIAYYNEDIFIFKDGGLYRIDVSDSNKVYKVDVGLDAIRSYNNGQAVCAHKMFLYFSWGGFTIQRYYGAGQDVDLTSVGYDVGVGLPSDRAGKCVQLISLPFGIMAVNESAGYSSVLLRDDETQGWTEVFRSPVSGWKISQIHWQDCPGTNPRLWIACNGELYYQEWPYRSFNPLEDTGMNYQHECSVITPIMDMGVGALPKMFKEISLITDDLQDGQYVAVEYQVDEHIGTANWRRLMDVTVSPRQETDIGASDARKIRFRYRLNTDDADDPCELVATVVSGFARTPHKKQWTHRFRLSNEYPDKIGAPDEDPDDLIEFLYYAADNARVVYQECRAKSACDVHVIVEPPVIRREQILTDSGSWVGTVEVTVREA